MSYHIDNLEYSLCKRVVSMERGFSIETDYGRIEVDAEDAKAIITATRKMLERKLKRALHVEAKRAELAKAEGGR